MKHVRLLAAIVCLNLAALVAGAAPLPNAELAADAEGGGYDVFATLSAIGPHQQILLDWADSGGLVLTFSAEATTLSFWSASDKRMIAQGKAAVPGEVHIKRRVPMVEVSQKGAVLLRTWSRRALAEGQPVGPELTEGQGQVAPATGAKMAEFRVQPVADIYFSDEFLDPEGSASVWEPLTGTWKIGIYRDALIQRDHGDKGPIGASWYEVTDAERAVAVAGYDFWDGYQARVAARATAGTRLGLVFYCQDADNYALLSVKPAEAEGEGIATLSLTRDGHEEALAQETVSWRADTWYELAVEAVDERISCRVAGIELFASALPAFTSGRVGLFADGPGLAKFDDVLVRSVHVTRDDFDRPVLAGCWNRAGGDWDLANGSLHAGSDRMARCLRVGAGWPATYVAADVTPASGAAGVCLNWTGRSGYILSAESDQYTLAKFVDGKRTILTTGPIDKAGHVPLRLSYDHGRLCAKVGAIEEVVYDFDGPRAGRCGLSVAGKAEFDDFEAGELLPPGAEISAISGKPQYVPGEREGTRRPVLGYVWQPRGGRWSAKTIPDCPPGLGPGPYGDRPTALWYFQPCPGDAVITAENSAIPQGTTLGLALACEDGDIGSGYALEVSQSSPLRLKLLRRGEIVAEAETSAQASYDLSLWRDGDYVVATAGDAGLAYKDDQPLLGGRCCAYARGTGAIIGKLSLGNRRAHYYAFREIETDWQPQEGEWMAHSGLTCIAWDYWLTGKGTRRAMSYNIRPQPHNLQVDFWVSEHTLGYTSGRHQHFPYYNISLVTCGKSRSPDSGYRFLIAGENGRVTQLLRLGQVVAETRDRRFWITMGYHCNSPRAIHVVVSQLNGQISLRINDVEALQFTDSEPLSGGYVGIGVEDCAANFRDFWMAPATSPDDS